jgi:transposase
MAVVNPAQVRAFAQALGKRAKTDPMKYSASVTNVARPSHVESFIRGMDHRLR